MTATYNPFLVIISALVAVLASYTALELASRVTTSQDTERKIWLVGGAITMGTGIWSMHFIAMLAFSLPIFMSYNFFIVVVSLLAAIVASGQAMFIVSRPIVSLSALLASATFMGVGIATMHYVGMAAMQMMGTIHYNPILFLLSVAFAVMASLVALLLFLQFRKQTQMASKNLKIISAIVMAAAILLMHYTGMAAATFKANSDYYKDSFSIDNDFIAFIVTSLTIFILVETLVFTADKSDARRDFYK